MYKHNMQLIKAGNLTVFLLFMAAFSGAESFTYNLDAGENYVSLPLETSQSLMASSFLDLAVPEGACRSISKFEHSTWRVVIHGLTYNDFEMKPGEAYAVRCAEDATIMIDGDEVSLPLEISVEKSHSFFSIPETGLDVKASYVLRSMAEQGGNCTKVSKYFGNTWVPYKPGSEDFVLNPGEGYAVYCQNAFTYSFDVPEEDGGITTTSEIKHHNYNFYAGNNVFSLPFTPVTPLTAKEFISGYVRSQGGEASVIYEWKNGAYRPYIFGETAGDFPLIPGQAYTIVFENDAEVSLQGKEVAFPFSLQLKTGLNFIGVPEGTPEYTAEEFLQLLSNEDRRCTKISKNQDGDWLGHSINTTVNNFTIKAGEGYALYCINDGQFLIEKDKTLPLGETFLFRFKTGKRNLISLPLAPLNGDLDNKTFLKSVNDAGNYCPFIYRLNDSSTGYDVYSLSGAGAKFNISPGRGYVLACEREGEFLFRGTSAGLYPLVINLNRGFNLIGVPSDLKASVFISLANAGGDNCSKVFKYLREGQWDTHNADNPGVRNFTMTKGEAYFVKCEADARVTINAS